MYASPSSGLTGPPSRKIEYRALSPLWPLLRARSAHGEIKSCVNDWQRTLARLSKLAGVRFHAHQLRDSFAVDLLEIGVSFEDVATLLGNTIKIAEKHYAPRVKSPQVKLEESIEKAWRLS